MLCSRRDEVETGAARGPADPSELPAEQGRARRRPAGERHVRGTGRRRGPTRQSPLRQAAGPALTARFWVLSHKIPLRIEWPCHCQWQVSSPNSPFRRSPLPCTVSLHAGSHGRFLGDAETECSCTTGSLPCPMKERMIINGQRPEVGALWARRRVASDLFGAVFNLICRRAAPLSWAYSGTGAKASPSVRKL